MTQVVIIPVARIKGEDGVFAFHVKTEKGEVLATIIGPLKCLEAAICEAVTVSALQRMEPVACYNTTPQWPKGGAQALPEKTVEELLAEG